MSIFWEINSTNNIRIGCGDAIQKSDRYNLHKTGGYLSWFGKQEAIVLWVHLKKITVYHRDHYATQMAETQDLTK